MNITLHHLRLSLFAAIGIGAFALASPPPAAAANVWTGTTPSGDAWNDGANWSLGVPTAAEFVDIVNGGTAIIASGSTAVAGVLTIGNAAAGSLVISSAATLTNSNHAYLGFGGVGAGTATVSGTWALSGAGRNMEVGRLGEGTLNIESGGVVSVVGTVFVAGTGATGVGTVNLESGGLLDVGAANKAQLAFGLGGDATLNIKGGTLNAASVDTRAAGGTGVINFNHSSGSYDFKNNDSVDIAILGITQVNVVAGTTTLGATNNTYTGATTISGGTLLIDGSIASSSGVSVAAGATLGGHGEVSSISGAGTVAPGNSPGILTATSLDPSAGMDFEFEFTGTTPNFGDAEASVNDVLRLTDATPFTASLTSGNEVTLDFTGATVASGDIFIGGFYTDNSASFLTSVEDAEFTLLGVGAGLAAELSVVQLTADFGSGNINGYVTQFEFSTVPEPGSLAMCLLGGAMMVVAFSRRQRRR